VLRPILKLQNEFVLLSKLFGEIQGISTQTTETIENAIQKT
jgi:hypothetical protein